MAKSRNNLLGVGGQRKKVSRAEQQGAGPERNADRKTAAEQKAELLRRMRERAAGTEAEPSDAPAAGQEAPEQDAPAQS
ncbi:DUF6243 family protein [Streptomyces poriferorum]|uniref:DUF6243 family protein n=1 Tax=Streptomyces poriferorum TaxID=2798799 RepID=A0ABY9IWJ4_9ACTN|nr:MULTISPECIES: DUF6243 family protein [unclassified Streptomyces]WSQ46569.1 DUF6243 family protein [Streptomyces sp. NBC_01220]MDP5311821.1 DUF6243 family protein [Streptomyces sp. Alt4]WLQ48203.1 DUF6243 family protein [Streptomyces sp. Alt1]WLQ59109.1 DUF6243 family protein [Streptomyces sp. Alt2]WSI63027.1 DUF6243 family protein [Streptomyces sp. NBC_01336]